MEVFKTDVHQLEIYSVEEAEEKHVPYDELNTRQDTVFLDETYCFFVPADWIPWFKKVVSCSCEGDILPDDLDKLFPIDAPFNEPLHVVEVLKKSPATLLEID